MSVSLGPSKLHCKKVGTGSTSRSLRAVWPTIAILIAALIPGLGGCARRAYNDVYVENMAAEIRDLEDQLYEFDGEYRLMEQQLEALRAENNRLKSGLPAPTNNRSLRQDPAPAFGGNSSNDYFVPKASPSSPSTGSPSTGSPSTGSPSTGSPSTGSPSAGSSPSDTKRTNPSPAPSLDSGSPPGAATPRSTMPSAPGSNNNSSTSPAPSIMPSPLPPPKPVPGAEKSDQFNPDDLKPPTIDLGEPKPPTLPPIKPSPTDPLTMETNNELELELGQIKLPAQLASLRDQGQSAQDSSIVRAAQIHPAAEMPADTRIVNIKFHPTLCRAVNSDGQGDDEGLYLVLQPYNEAGEFVPLPADLLVLALDLSRDEKHATIGRWTMSAADVKSKMNPIGSSQGIHLSLSFSGPAPQCDRVLVFAYYTLADGRRIVAEQEVMLNNLHRQSAVWVPRSKSEVRTVSHEAPIKK